MIDLKNKTTFIFDMDGLLVDTERLHVRFWKETLPGDPKKVDELVHHTIGTSGDVVKELCAHYLGDATIMERLSDVKQSKLYAYIEKEGLDQKAGAGELLNVLKQKGLRSYVASSSKLKDIHFCLKAASLGGFDGIISGDDVKHTKPAPDIYLKVLETYDLDPAKCVVLEDSINGITAAIRAGIDVIGIPDLVSLDRFREREHIDIYPSLNEVVRHLG
jgi:HAD superfamily hydrolase (TIGR01509 family)